MSGVSYQITASFKLSSPRREAKDLPRRLSDKNRQGILIAVTGGLKKIYVFICVFKDFSVE